MLTTVPVLPLPPTRTGTQSRAVVQNASNKELQLPAMAALTTKASVQQCFLRTLNTLITLRDSALCPVFADNQIFDFNAEIKSTQKISASNATANEQTEAGKNQNTDANHEPMEVDETKKESNFGDFDVPLSRFLPLNETWDFLGECLNRLSNASDPHIVLVLQQAVEAFFLVHAFRKKEDAQNAAKVTVSGAVTASNSVDTSAPNVNLDIMPASPPTISDSLVASQHPEGLPGPSTSQIADLPEDVKKFVKFAEEHRTVLNQILRQSNEHLSDGPFSVLVDYTRILDFDVKRRYFRKELERMDDGFRRDDIAVRIRRDHLFPDSFRELFRLRPNEWKSRFYIIFEGEEGQDAGGLLREWYSVITREIFNPHYALFQTAPGDRVTYMINPSSYVNIEHLDYFKFVGRLIAKAVYDNKLLDCFFTRAFYKHILSKQVKYNDLESEDPSFYQSLVFLLENPISAIGHELTFSLEVNEFGKLEVRDLKANGRDVPVVDENKKEYVRLVCQMKMTGAIRQQLNAFLTGFYDIIPKNLISIFNEQELELLISGLPTIDVDDLQANTEYNKYTKTSLQIVWFWRALRSFDQADRAKFLQFVTGTSKVPLQGFASLEGMHGIQRFQIHRDDRSTDRLPTAHT
uniref:HECT-type E3 ubiquitin transferase n=1 Tax=Romanomermis culicivorax TaxID=13658 RepID=A0A915HS62_ROMCU